MPGCDIPVTRAVSAPAKAQRRPAYARFITLRKQVCGNTCAITLRGAGHNSVTRRERVMPSRTTGDGPGQFTAFSAR